MLPDQPVIFVFLGIFLVWLLTLTGLVYRLISFNRKFTKGISKKDLRSVLDKLLKDFAGESKKVNQLIKDQEKLTKANFNNIQKIGLVRYNPFAETGGNQSFCLSVLDGQDNGLVISSLHSRDTTRVYAKPVKKGIAAGYELSDEEKQAIKKAKSAR
jgi:hypothetical protein